RFIDASVEGTSQVAILGTLATGTDNTTPDVENTVKGYPHKVYQDDQGNALIETYLITGMGHGAPVDPGTGEDRCGVPGGHILDADICASYFIGKFWGLDQ
ncbi:hypothetical protein KQ940_09815, partial [Marinobacterium sp. D7]|nr:hypothetical protein [Marinobacterium ramblicola]